MVRSVNYFDTFRYFEELVSEVSKYDTRPKSSYLRPPLLISIILFNLSCAFKVSQLSTLKLNS